MTGQEDLGVSAGRKLNAYAQVIRRESPEWRSMSQDERREEILGLVEDAAGSFVREQKTQAEVIAKMFLVDLPDQWPYWDFKSQEVSNEGWFAWHVVDTIVGHFEQVDPEQLKKPPLSEWLTRNRERQEPSRKRGRPKGARGMLHQLAVMGVRALIDADLCGLTGEVKGGGRSCCELVAGRLGIGHWRTVHRAWRADQKQLARSVERRFVPHLEEDPEAPFPYEDLVWAATYVARTRDLLPNTVLEAWKSDRQCGGKYPDVYVGSSDIRIEGKWKPRGERP